MLRLGRALVLHEFQERVRDRWVVVISLLFASMAAGVSVYGRSAGEQGAMLTGPSLVTLAGLLVPLVALVLGHDAICGERERNTLGLLLSMPTSPTEVIVAKYIGRLLALVSSVGFGLGAALLVTDASSRPALVALVGPTLLLGAAFLALGVLLSVISSRQATAISLAVAAWFLLVFFYDMGLLGLMVMSDGAVSSQTVSNLVAANPVGLFRLSMMQDFSRAAGVEDIGGIVLPGPVATALIWAFWTIGLLALSCIVLVRQKAHR